MRFSLDGRILIRIAGRNLRQLNRRRFEVEHFPRAFEPRPIAQSADHEIPSGREVSSTDGVPYSRDPDAKRISDGVAAEGICEFFGCHAPTDNTNGVLQQARNWLFVMSVATPEYSLMEERKKYPDIARRLCAVREAFSDLNRKDWAGRCGFNATQYTNWENGARRIPLEAAERLASRYGLTLDWIYLGREDGLSENARSKLGSQPRR